MNDRPYKSVWTEEDFDVMNWHDVMIHGLSITPKEYDYELLLDIDYIFEWINPVSPETRYTFLIAPATLVFNGVWDIKAKLETRISVLEPVSILEITRDNPSSADKKEFTTWDWEIVLEQGSIRFNGCGYIQYIRSKPILSQSIHLTDEQRGGFSFDKI